MQGVAAATREERKMRAVCMRCGSAIDVGSDMDLCPKCNTFPVGPQQPHKKLNLPKYRYVVLHIPTNNYDVREAEFLTRQEFLESLNKWNRLGIGLWQYAEEYDRPTRSDNGSSHEGTVL